MATEDVPGLVELGRRDNVCFGAEMLLVGTLAGFGVGAVVRTADLLREGVGEVLLGSVELLLADFGALQAKLLPAARGCGISLRDLDDEFAVFSEFGVVYGGFFVGYRRMVAGPAVRIPTGVGAC